MLALIRHARRRLFYQALLAQGANTASAALLAFIVLLLLGAEVLDWRWLVLIPTAAAAAGIWLARRRLPSRYRVAQIVDLRMSLADTLSTALFFEGAEAERANADIRRQQAAAAERMAATVDVRRATPFTMPRTVYGMAALLLVAGSLFALRYAVSRRLDLRPSLAVLLEQSFGEKTEMARNLPHFDADDMQQQDRDADAIKSEDARAAGNEDADQDRSDDSATQNRAAADSKKEGAKGQDQQGQQDGKQNGDEAGQGSPRAGNQNESGKQGSQQGKEGNSKQDNGGNGSENSSLVSRLKDALQNLLSRMNPRDGQSGEPQSGEQKNQQAGSQQKGGQQRSAKNGQQKGGQQQADAQSDSNQAQNSEQAGDKGTGNSDAPQSSKQPGSGVGSQNGDKDIKQAEQLAAMGKISEIIGKRQQNISGETTVEVQSSTTQALRTPYAQRGAEHSESNADINRDEIPAALEAYVQQYFEQVRKPAKK